MNNNKLEIRRLINVVQILLYILLSTYVISTFFSVSNLKYIQISLSTTIIIVFLSKINDIFTLHDLIFGFVLFLLLLAYRFISYPFNVSFSIKAIHLVIAYSFGILISKRALNRYFLYFYLLLALTPFVYTLFILKVQPSSHFYNMNRNSITFVNIFVVSLLFLYDILNKKTYTFLVPSMALSFISFASKSRSGLIMSSYLLLLIVSYNVVMLLRKFISIKRNRKILLIILFLSLLFLFLTILIYFLQHSRLQSEGFGSSGRISIYEEFFGKLNFRTFIFGLKHDPVNPRAVYYWHNSFITLLSDFGIVAIPIFILIIGAFFKLAKISWFLSALLLLWVGYSMPETISPFNYGDYLLIPLLMVAYPPKRLNIPINQLFNRNKNEIDT